MSDLKRIPATITYARMGVGEDVSSAFIIEVSTEQEAHEIVALLNQSKISALRDWRRTGKGDVIEYYVVLNPPLSYVELLKRHNSLPDDYIDHSLKWLPMMGD